MAHARFRVVNDPVCGQVALTPIEVKLLDSSSVRRLDGLRQLGCAHLVYPMAAHSRFMHAIGSLGVASRILQRVQHTPGSSAAIDEPTAAAVRVAALLHDVAHLPFDHTLRRLQPRDLATDHPSRLGELLDRSDVTSTLQEHSQALPDMVRALLLPPNRDIAPELAPLRSIVNGPLDADRLDYLMRDSRSVGLPFGVDLAQLLDSLAMTPQGLALDVRERSRRSRRARDQLFALTLARRHLYERVLFHRTVRAADAMLSTAVSASMEAGDLAFDSLAESTDQELLSTLSESRNRRSRDLVTALEERRLFRIVCQVAYTDVAAPPGEARAAMELAVADACRRSGIAPDDVACEMIPEEDLPDEGSELVWSDANRVELARDFEPSLVFSAMPGRAMRDLAGYYVFVAHQHAGRVDVFARALFDAATRPARSAITIRVRARDAPRALSILVASGTVGYPAEPFTYEVAAEATSRLEAAGVPFVMVRT